MTQKELATKLDAMAAKAAAEGRKPATPKQIWYLAGLMLKEGHTGIAFQDYLTNYDAHNFIEQYTHKYSWMAKGA